MFLCDPDAVLPNPLSFYSMVAVEKFIWQLPEPRYNGKEETVLLSLLPFLLGFEVRTLDFNTWLCKSARFATFDKTNTAFEIMNTT